MITIAQYCRQYNRSTDFVWDLCKDEFHLKSYHTIKIAGKDYPQNLLTALKRINRKVLKNINHTIKSLQIKQKVKQGYAYTKKRFATVPLWLDIDFLIELDKAFEKGEVWHIEYDENNLPIKKILTSRHPYRAELQKLKTMAILKKQF